MALVLFVSATGAETNRGPVVARLGSPYFSATGHVEALAFSRDGTLLAGAFGDKEIPNEMKVHLWETGTGRQIGVLPYPGKSITFLEFTSDGRLLLANDVAWDVRKKEIAPIGWDGLAVAASGSGTLVTLDQDDHVTVWTIGAEAAEVKRRFERKGQAIQSAALTPDGRTLGLFTKDQKLELWDLTTGGPLHPPRQPAEKFTAITFAPDGKQFALHGLESAIGVFDLASGGQVRKLHHQHNLSYSFPVAVFSPGGRYLAASNTSGISVWELDTGFAVGTNVERLHNIEALAFAPDDKYLAIAYQGYDDIPRIDLWDTNRWDRIKSSVAPRSVLRRLVYSPDGEHLVAQSQDGKAYVWHLPTQKLNYSTEPVGTMDVRISADGWLLGLLGHYGVFRIYELQSGRTIVRTNTHRNDINTGRGALSPHLDRVTFQRHEVTIETFATAYNDSLSKFRAYQGERSDISTIVYSPDGRRLATLGSPFLASGQTPSVEIWDAETGELVAKLQRALPIDESASHDNYSRLAWSPDGATLLAVGRGCDLWDVERRANYAQLKLGDTYGFSPDGKWLAHLTEHELALLELATARPCLTIPLPERRGLAANDEHDVRFRRRRHAVPYTSVAISPDLGHVSLSVLADSTIVIWSLEPKSQRPKSVAMLWDALTADDASLAYQAIWQLASRKTEAMTLFADKLLPVTTDEIDETLVRRLIDELDHDDFKAREKASDDLTAMGSLVVPFLKRALEDDPPAEVAVRASRILDVIQASGLHFPREQLRRLRAIQALEMMGTPEAAAHLAWLASGNVAARGTRDAEAALLRLSARAIVAKPEQPKN